MVVAIATIVATVVIVRLALVTSNTRGVRCKRSDAMVVIALLVRFQMLPMVVGVVEPCVVVSVITINLEIAIMLKLRITIVIAIGITAVIVAYGSSFFPWSFKYGHSHQVRFKENQVDVLYSTTRAGKGRGDGGRAAE